MKTRIQNLFLVLALLAGVHQAAAQGTAFTYQGQLNVGGSPANGSYDLSFTVFDALTNGNIIAGPRTNSATAVSNGLFAVTLNFGGSVFTGPARWLQLDVRTNGNGAFTTLSPLEPVMPVPYAIMANSASNLLGTVAAAQLSGTLQATQLPSSVLTNNQSGLTLSGTFTGNGSGLTNLNVVIPSIINENSITIGPTNMIAPLTVPPNVPPSAIGSVATAGSAYSVAVAGRYAYVVNQVANVSGPLQIFDVSIPSAPVSIGSVATAGGGGGSTPLSVTVAGRYAYVGGQNFPLQIFDVSNPSAPVVVGYVNTGYDAVSVAVAGRYAYVVNQSSSTLQVSDVSTPSAPVSVGSVGTGSEPTSVAVAGRYAYVVNYGANTLQIFDVSTPSAPVSVGSVGTGNGPLSVAVAGRYAYVVNGTASTLQIFDVSIPSSPVSVGSVGTGSYPWSVAVAGRYAYVVNYVAGTLQIFDVSTPSAPVSVGSVGAGYQPNSVAVAGRYAYVATAGGTLQVFDLGGAYIQQLEAGAMETGTLQTRDTVTVGNNLNVRGGLTVSASALINGSLSVNSNALINGGLSVNNGPVGIGLGVSAPSYTLQVNGSVAGVGAYNNLSDARYKTNITTLNHALDKVMAMRGVKYDWRIAEYPQLRFDAKPQLGFIAQEIKGVLPEAVSQDAQGNYSIAYSEVIPVLVEAVKDQQMEITNKDAEIQDLKARVEKLELSLEPKNGGGK